MPCLSAVCQLIPCPLHMIHWPKLRCQISAKLPPGKTCQVVVLRPQPDTCIIHQIHDCHFSLLVGIHHISQLKEQLTLVDKIVNAGAIYLPFKLTRLLRFYHRLYRLLLLNLLKLLLYLLQLTLQTYNGSTNSISNIRITLPNGSHSLIKVHYTLLFSN